MLRRIEDKYHQFLDKYLGPDDSMLLPRETNFRWIPLFFACLTTFGTYYGHDTPALLQTSLQTIFELNTTKFNLLFSLFYLPCMIMPIIGGLLTDKIGVRTGMVLFSVLVLLGQVLVTYGVANRSFEMMLIGRVLHGIGHDCLLVGKKAIIAKWFLKGEIAFAMGLGLCVSRLGSSLSSYLTPKFYTSTADISYPFSIGVYTSLFSIVCVLILNSVDRYADFKEHRRSLSHTKDEFQFSDLKKFPFMFYLLVINCIAIYPIFFSFLNNCSDMMVKRFGFSIELAGSYITIVYSMGTIMTPIFGLFADKVGRKLYIILFAAFIPFFDHLYMAFMENTVDRPNEQMAIALIGLGIFYSSYASMLWPCITAVVLERVRATAYGLVVSLENLVLTLMPLMMGRIHDLSINISFGYFYTEITFAALSIFGILASIWLLAEDKKNGGTLNSVVTPEEDILLNSGNAQIEMGKK